VPKKGTQPQDWCRYILNYGDNRFHHEQEFILTLFNQKQRHAAANTVAPKIKAHPKMVDQFIKLVNKDTFKADLIFAIKNPKSQKAKTLLNKILPTLNLTGATVPFGEIDHCHNYTLCANIMASQHGLLRSLHQILIRQ
jgi:hypothetical protein